MNGGSIPLDDRRSFRFLAGPGAFLLGSWIAYEIGSRQKGSGRRAASVAPMVNQVVCVGRAAGGRWPTVSRLDHRFHNALHVEPGPRSKKDHR